MPALTAIRAPSRPVHIAFLMKFGPFVSVPVSSHTGGVNVTEPSAAYGLSAIHPFGHLAPFWVGWSGATAIQETIQAREPNGAQPLLEFLANNPGESTQIRETPCSA